jgi:hypothetical protein
MKHIQHSPRIVGKLLDLVAPPGAMPSVSTRPLEIKGNGVRWIIRTGALEEREGNRVQVDARSSDY